MGLAERNKLSLEERYGMIVMENKWAGYEWAG